MVLKWRWCIVFIILRFSDEDFKELGWSSEYVKHKVEQKTKRRTFANRGVDSDQIEPAQALREPARISDREQHFVAH